MPTVDPGSKQQRGPGGGVTPRRPHSGRSLSQDTVKTFVRRANRLFDLRCERDGHKYSPQEFADLIKAETGERVSHEWIRQIRTGRISNTTLASVEILAHFFGVKSAYFLVAEHDAERVEAQLRLLAEAQQAGIRSIAALGAISPASLGVAALAEGVDVETLDAVRIILARARKAQGLDDAEPEPNVPPATGD
jgi:hypothetical protein